MPLPPSEYLSQGVFQPNQYQGRVVFCTGGAGDICSAQVRALVFLGANAAIVGRNKEKTERVAADIATARDGAKVLGLGEVDVRSKESLQGAVQTCVEALGGIDILIAGAAGNFLAPITQLSENAFKSVIEIDVLGSYNTVKAALPALFSSADKAKRDGSPAPSILFVSATLHYAGTPLQSHVSAAKSSVDSLSNSCAIELGPRGIRSNVISPGPISGTEGVERLSRPEDRPNLSSSIPLGRMGLVRDIADATCWLCGRSASYVNGTAIVVDGGAWRMVGTAQPGTRFSYPEFLLSDEKIEGVKGMKKEKPNL